MKQNLFIFPGSVDILEAQAMFYGVQAHTVPIHSDQTCRRVNSLYLPTPSQIARSMGPTWGRQDPGGLHVGPMTLVIRACYLFWAASGNHDIPTVTLWAIVCFYSYISNWQIIVAPLLNKLNCRNGSVINTIHFDDTLNVIILLFTPTPFIQ